MPTINQLSKNKKRISKKINLKKTPALNSNPQKHGTCVAVFTKTPRKPNSALRKVAKVRLVNSRIVTVYIPGEGHNISRFSDVLIAGRRIRDLPGVKYGAIRGKFDLASVQKKKTVVLNMVRVVKSQIMNLRKNYHEIAVKKIVFTKKLLVGFIY